MPVYNVAMPLLARLNPDRPPYLVVEIPLEAEMTHAQPPGTGVIAPPIVKTA